MTAAEERDRRVKGINFIMQVGIMLKLPQMTLSTAAIFFQRFLMRASLSKERDGIPKLHHFQAAATALFLATKVEESCRKMKELVLAFCRVAQKNPNLVVDEQSKDFWRWRDLILHNEDHMLETLCFDLTVESPHRQLFEMLKFYGVEHNKRLRNSAWGFVSDSNNTQLCLLVSSRTIAVASLYAACKYCEVSLPDDSKERPWWETQHVRLNEIRRAVEYMLSNYDGSANKVNGVSAQGASDGHGSIYAGLLTPALETPALDGAPDGWDKTRMRADGSASPFLPHGSDRRLSNASSIGAKRDREDGRPSTDGVPTNGGSKGDQDSKRPRLESFPADEAPPQGADLDKAEPNPIGPNTVAENGIVDTVHEAPAGSGEVGDLKEREEALQVIDGDTQAELDVKAQQTRQAEAVQDTVAEMRADNKAPLSAGHVVPSSTIAKEDGELSEEGELEE